MAVGTQCSLMCGWTDYLTSATVLASGQTIPRWFRMAHACDLRPWGQG